MFEVKDIRFVYAGQSGAATVLCAMCFALFWVIEQLGQAGQPEPTKEQPRA